MQAKKEARMRLSLKAKEVKREWREKWENEWKKKGSRLRIQNDWNSMRNINRTFIHSFAHKLTTVFNLLSFFVLNLCTIFWHFTRTSCFSSFSSYFLRPFFAAFVIVVFFFLLHSIPCARYQWNTIFVVHETPTPVPAVISNKFQNSSSSSWIHNSFEIFFISFQRL